MRTLVVSDLHLGATSGADVLRRPALREPLLEALRDGVGRLVVCGDALELREVPLRGAAEHFVPLLRAAGEVLGPDGEIVVTAGNHDHLLLGGWLQERLLGHPQEPMGLEHRIAPEQAGPLGAALAGAAGPARLELAYPGVWLREDVYAFHGHYADLHTTVPTIERLAAGAMRRWLSPVPEHGAGPDDYEAVLAPLYAWMFAVAQRADDGAIRAGAKSSAGAWDALAGDGKVKRPARAAVLTAGFVGAVRAANALGLGPLRSDLSGQALRQGYLRAVPEVLRRLGIAPAHVVFGHTHRSGPWPGDDPQEWRTASGTQLHNTGSWVYQPHFVGGPAGASPYWPGTCVVVDDEGPPRLRALLAGRSHSELRAGSAADPVTPGPA